MLACSTRLTSKIVPGASNTLGISKGSNFCNAGKTNSKCIASAVLAHYTPAAVYAIHKIR